MSGDNCTQKEQRKIQAELYRLVIEGKRENVKVLEEHRAYLDLDIDIIGTSTCSCVRAFEQHPWHIDDAEGTTLQTLLSQITKGCCGCDFPYPNSMYRDQPGSKRLVHVAAAIGHVWLLQFLADHSCDLNAQTLTHRLTPIFLAVRRYNVDATEFLVSQKVDVNIDCDAVEKITPLVETILSDKPDLFDRLLNVPDISLETVNFRGETPLLVAIRREFVVYVEKLLVRGAAVNVQASNKNSPLMYAVSLRNLELVQCLIKHNADLNIQNTSEETALFIAAYEEEQEIIECLLKAGANPNIRNEEGNCPLIIAAYYDNHKIIDVLLQNGADAQLPNKQNYTATHIAAWNGHIQSLQELLKAGAKHDCLTFDRNTPLALAAHGNQPKVVDLLLPLGCDLNNADKDKDTMLHYATYNNMVDTVQKLIDNGADPNVTNRLNTTPLWNAVYKNHKDVVKILLSANVDMEIASVGIDQHAQSDDVVEIYPVPKSPLWVAMNNNSPEIVMMLVSAGYNIYIEKWLLNSEFPLGCADNDTLCTLLTLFASSPPRLLLICRNLVRKLCPGKRIKQCVNCLEIPGSLKRCLTLKDLTQ